MPEDRDEIEQKIEALCAAGDMNGAAAAIVRAYGPEILGFLTAQHRDELDADEVFSIWCERLLRGLPAFARQCSVRTWAYTLARNASHNHRRDERARQRRAVPMSGALSDAAALVRTETRPYLRTEAKSKLAALRDALPPEDRMLLVLRLDKGLEWKDIAWVLLGDEALASDETLKRTAQRARKRFQILKDRLIEEGRRAGLIGGEE